MKKFIAVSALVFFGMVGLYSTVEFLLSLPGVLDFFSRNISKVSAALGYKEEVLLAVGGLVIAAWFFDREVDRGENARKAIAGLTFVCALVAFGLLVQSIDRLGDGDSWISTAVANNVAVASPHERGETTGKGGVDAGGTPTPGQSSEQPTSGAGGESPGAFSSKGGSSSSGGCTCPSPEKFEQLPPERNGGEGGAVESEGWNERAEEEREALEEAEEERELAEEEAESEAEMGEVGIGF
jgi:hypothetical protein